MNNAVIYARVSSTGDQKAEEYKETLKLLRKGYPYRKVAKLCGVSESTVKRLKKEFEI